MERGGGYTQSLAHSFSLPSLVEGSEPISEAEEFVEMKSLTSKGDKALQVKDFSGAIRYYNEALEIDEQNSDVLLARAVACIEMGDYIKAQKDVEMLLSQDTDNPKAFKVQGIALRHLHQYKEALNSFLVSLELDPDNSDELTDLISDVAAQFCNIPQEMKQSLKEMDSYKKLSEVGVCLFQAKKYKICIKVLDAAQKFQTNQKGITMRILLTSANAHTALKHTEKAIGLYQECLTTAISTHDQVYQTKALVNIATLFLENHDTHQAIIFYEKLLHLEAELLAETGSEEELPDFWTKELRCGLHLNLSIAYKAIGDMVSAIKHAEKYITFIEKYNFQGKLKAESYHNTGMLNEILGNYNDAINNYNKYLQECKGNGDKKGMAQAYGCLGSVYAALRNWQLSVTYHEQYVAMASRFDDSRMKIIANEMLADTLMLRGHYESAVKSYEEMINSCIRTDYRTRATGMCKLGHAYRALKKNQYSLYFYEQAAELAEDFDFPEIEMLSHYNLACINQSSTQMLDLEKAHKYFEQLIPYYESKIREHTAEDSHCPQEYHTQLQECYDGIQTVLTKLGNKEACLQYAEAYRKRSLTQTHNYQASAMTSQSHTAPWDMWTLDRITRIVSQQQSTVLYYSLVTEYLLLWVLQPATGLVRFYARKATGGENMITKFEALLSEMCDIQDWKKLQTQCEARALPLKSSDLDMTRRKNLTLSKSEKLDETDGENKKIQDENKAEKTVDKRLYDLLFSPVEDILTKLPKESPLIIIPDKCLHHCPFHALKDFLNRFTYQRFQITCLPNLLLLDKVIANQNYRLRALDDLAFERQQNKKGGILKISSKWNSRDQGARIGSDDSNARVNSMKVSHPRMLSRPVRTPMTSPRSSQYTKHTYDEDKRRHNMIPPYPGQLPKQQTMYEEDFKMHTPWKSASSPRGKHLANIVRKGSFGTFERVKIQIINRIHDTVFDQDHHCLTLVRSSAGLHDVSDVYTGMTNTPRPPGSPTSLDKMMSFQTYSTLTTETSTGTDITSSHSIITPFTQISSQDRCLVVGNPKLPHSLMLHGRSWRPGLEELVGAKREAFTVASYMEVAPLNSTEATKDKFLKEVEKATVVHIVTYGCLTEGLLVMTPSPIDVNSDIPTEESYLVTVDDILGLKLTAELVVLSTGYTPYRKHKINAGYHLSSAFLAAGAQCVLQYMWPLPDLCVEKFFKHFYLALQNGALVTMAARSALLALKEDDRYSQPMYWSGFILVGKDVQINLKTIRHAMLDQTLDQTEAEFEDGLSKEFLNPKPVLAPVRKKGDNLRLLQQYLCLLLKNQAKQAKVIPELIDLMDSSLKRLHTEENNKQTTVISNDVMVGAGALDLLKLLGFHFQAKGATLENPYVLYPHWNRDELLIPAYDALRAIQEITESPSLVQALCSALPISQDFISLMVDLFSVTKHAPEIQLKVSDLSVRPLWLNMKIKKVLVAAGYHQIGMLLNFNRTPEYRRIMSALFQLLLSASQHKSQVLLYRLDVNLLGTSSISKASSDYPELTRLPSLAPLILPRNQLCMSTPWLSKTETQLEMKEKLQLARGKTDLDENFKDHLVRAKTWHQMTVTAQANETLQDYGRAVASASKVKVISGSTASMIRVPVDQKVVLKNPEVDQRRDYAHYVYQQRLKNINLRYKNDTLGLYLPYVNTV